MLSSTIACVSPLLRRSFVDSEFIMATQIVALECDLKPDCVNSVLLILDSESWTGECSFPFMQLNQGSLCKCLDSDLVKGVVRVRLYLGTRWSGLNSNNTITMEQ